MCLKPLQLRTWALLCPICWGRLPAAGLITRKRWWTQAGRWAWGWAHTSGKTGRKTPASLAHLPAAWWWGVGSTRSHCFLVPPLSQKQWCKITGIFPEWDSHDFAARAEGTYRPTEFSLGWQYGRVRFGAHWTRARSLDPYLRFSVRRLVYCYCDTRLSNRFLIAHTFLMWHYREVQNAVYPPATVLRLLFCLEFSFESWSHLQLFSLTMSSVATSTRIISNPDSLILPEG